MSEKLITITVEKKIGKQLEEFKNSDSLYLKSRSIKLRGVVYHQHHAIVGFIVDEEQTFQSQLFSDLFFIGFYTGGELLLKEEL
ncbi:hypothetical protein [Nonlabens xiamenensis]|uniref:hypothetical protein n=1 Tax=Nonlabens xiamenensis TaxID=2341043 RepID=UPI000F604F5E|nr:hypothetical protein [Nonlabens xiamenensis]